MSATRGGFVRRRLVEASLVLAFTIAACGGSDSEDNASAGTCATLAESLCERTNACAASIVIARYGDEATCRSKTQAYCEALKDAPGSSITGSYLSSCTNALGSAGCGNLFDVLTHTCRPAGGSLDDGAACMDDAQCSGGYCKKDGGASCGACGSRIPAGGMCDGDPVACEPGSSCAFAGQCILLAGEGAECDPDQPCAPPLACNDGACAQTMQASDSCSDGAVCLPPAVCNGGACVVPGPSECK